ncbi:MAG: TIGR03936 family radical SAM-associated protein [Butyrivibrio sp.]|nr:TIGR03936 family radical SAM-associated protein [Butyrivibrio sp.]
MVKLRLKYSKNGPIKFIGHLDVMRYFQKAIRRADLDIKYSEGYSPHQLISFAQPLNVGSTSDGEYVDMVFESIVSPEDVVTRLNNTMNEGIKILDAMVLEEGAGKAMTLVAAAKYKITFRKSAEPDFDWEPKLLEYLSQENIPAIKKTKSGEKEINMKPLIYDYEIKDHALYCLISSGSVNNLKASLIIDGFMKSQGKEIDTITGIQLHKIENYMAGEDNNGPFFVPLISHGESDKIYI